MSHLSEEHGGLRCRQPQALPEFGLITGGTRRLLSAIAAYVQAVLSFKDVVSVSFAS